MFINIEVVRLLITYKYIVIFPLAALEGPIISLILGFLVHAGVFNFFLAYLILLFGDIIPDSIFYFIGYYGQDLRWVKRRIASSEFFTKNFDAMEKLWQNHALATMFFSKLAYGLALPFLISAGIVKIPYKKFISYAISVSFFQYGILIFIGYSSGRIYSLLIFNTRFVYIIMTGLALLIAGIYVLLIKFAKKKLVSLEKSEI